MKKIIITLAILISVLSYQVVCASSTERELHLKYDENTNLYGYVDNNNNWVIEPKFFSGNEFSEGLAFVIEGNGDRGYISTDGKYVFDENIEVGFGFSNKKAITEIYDKKDGKKNICIINNNGVILQKIDGTHSIRKDDNGFYYYTCDDGKNLSNYYFTTIYQLIDYPIGNILEIHDNIVTFSGVNNEIGLLNMDTGKMVVEYIDKDEKTYSFNEIKYSEGMYRAQFINSNTKYYTFFNNELNLITDQAFRKAKLFSEGVAVAGVEEDKTVKLGYLNKDGSFFITPKYKMASSFKDSLAIVVQEGVREVINRDGSTKLLFMFTDWYKDSSMSKEQYDYVYKESNKVINEIITDSMSELEKVKAINKYMIEYTKYDYENFSLRFTEGIPRSSWTPYGVFKYGVAVCEGYASATKILLDKAGLENIYIVGESRDEGHAWNLVKIDGNYYHLDTTWNDSNNCHDEFLLVSDHYMNTFGNRTWNTSNYPAVPKGYFD